MSVSSLFKNAFSPQELTDLYNSKIQQKASVGIDRINRRTFESRLTENIEVISRKVLNGKYHFSYFKEKLISKGRNSLPRVISIPTLRDKVVLKALNRVLQQTFETILSLKGIHLLIDEVINASNDSNWDYVIKIDIEGFYPSINHGILQKKIGLKIRKDEIRSLITQAITQRTVSRPDKNEPHVSVGVPQGLPISNILANIYFSGLDRKYRASRTFKYFRFVDDILIICKETDREQIYEQLIRDIRKLKLRTNAEKKHLGKINEGFQYLGYVIKAKSTSVRPQTRDRLIDSLIATFAQFSYSEKKSLSILEWKINLRITGCVIDGRRYGWLFYFSQINDYRLLFHLDHLVGTLAKRYKVDVSKISLKRFIRAFHEIGKNLTKTKYIPDFDDIDINQMRNVLSNIFLTPNVSKMTEEQVSQRFRRRIYATIKDLEKDINRTS